MGRLEFGRASWIPVLIASRTLGLGRPAIDHSKTGPGANRGKMQGATARDSAPAMVGRTSSSAIVVGSRDVRCRRASFNGGKGGLRFTFRFHQPTALRGSRHDLLGESCRQELARGFERRDPAGAFLASGRGQKKQDRVEDPGHDTLGKMRGVLGSSHCVSIAEQTAAWSILSDLEFAPREKGVSVGGACRPADAGPCADVRLRRWMSHGLNHPSSAVAPGARCGRHRLSPVSNRLASGWQ